MSVVKKVGQILYKRNKVWILMVLALSFLIIGNLASSSYNEQIVKDIFYTTMEMDLYFNDDGSFKNIYKNENMGLNEALVDGDPSYTGPNELEAFKKQNKDGLSQDYFSKYIDKYARIIDHYDISEDDFGTYNKVDEKQAAIEKVFQFKYFFRDKIVQNQEGIYKYNISDRLAEPELPVVLFVFILALMFLSVEHLSKYYEFTRIFPWDEKKTFLSKYLIGLVLVSLVYLAALLLKFLILRNSFIGPAIMIQGLGVIILRYYLIILGLYSLAMGIGAMAGNFVGHIGMIGIGILGFDLWEFNIRTLVSLVDRENSYRLADSLTQAVEGMPLPIQAFLRPLSVLTSSKETSLVLLGSIFIISLFFLGLGLVFTKRAKSERSQMFVLSAAESAYIKFLAVLTSASLVAEISFSIGATSLLPLGIFALSLGVFYKFYSFLFKARIGIS